VVTVFVGPEPEPSTFKIHIQRLGPLATQLSVEPEGEVKLLEEEPETFNLVMNWAYSSRLPRVRDLSIYFLPTPALTPIEDKPYAATFTPYPEPEYKNGLQQHYCTIAALPQYSDFSVEELRLYYTGESITGTTGIPVVIPYEEATRAETKQTALLKLLIFAEKYKWEALFNDAMEAFRHGEAQLRRQYVPTSQIFLAFTRCNAPSQVQNFVGHHALCLGFGNNLMKKYQKFVISAPAFFSFMLEHMDANIVKASSTAEDNNSNNDNGGGDGHGDGDNDGADGGSTNESSATGKADRTKMAYHIHDGRFIMDCPCPATGGVFSSSKSDEQPLPIFNLQIRAK
jgi:hypothetical protein